MTRDEITRLAMRDAETESPENLRAASGIYNRDDCEIKNPVCGARWCRITVAPCRVA